MRKTILLVILIMVFVILIAGCTEKEMQKQTKPLETTTPYIPQTPKKFDVDELKERIEKGVSESPGSKPVDITNIVYGDNKIFIEYVSAGPQEPVVYSYMIKIMRILNDYIKEKDINITEIRFRAVEWHYGDTYDITLTYSEMQKYLTGEYGFNEWIKKVNITRGT